MADAKIKKVNSDQVLHAVSELKKQGLAVSVRAVRAQIGSGSLTTVSRLLKDISSAQKPDTSPEERLSQFPDRVRDLCQSTVVAMAEAARALTAQERRKLQVLEDRLQSRWAANVKDKIRALRRLEVESKSNEELRAELKRANEKIWSDQELINKLTARVAKAESENEQLRELKMKLEERRDNLERQFEHFEQHALQQRRAESQMHLLKVTKLEQDLAYSQARVMDLSLQIVEASKRDR